MTRWRGASCVTVLVVAIVSLSGVGADAAARAALPGATETPADSWAVVPMGQLGVPANTFWQLLHATPGSSHWSVVTPQGVADNGGIVAGTGNGTASTVVGFLPSEQLRFSPLSVSGDSGITWKPAFLPGALAAHPDALASGPGGSLAIVGTAVLRGAPNGSSWNRFITLPALRRVAPRCGAAALDAVALASTGATFVGTACRHGHVGLFTSSGGAWHSDSLSLPGFWHDATTTILRLQSSGAGTTALLVATRDGRLAMFAMRQAANGNWRGSRPLSLGTGSTVRATAIDSGGAAAVLVGSRLSSSVADVGQDGTWVTLPAPPHGTVGLAWVTPNAISFGGISLDAFTVVGGTELEVSALTPAGSKWVVTQKLQVPLAYGSSS